MLTRGAISKDDPGGFPTTRSYASDGEPACVVG